MNTLLMMAVLPAVVLLVYIYRMDPVDKEPASLLLGLLFAGMLSTVPALIIEVLLTDLLFGGVEPTDLDSILVYNFLVVALTEEACKYVALKRRTWESREFDQVFDGIVYAVFVGLGFAIAENILYVFQFGPSTAVVRAFTAIPGHCMFAVFMGFFYGRARADASRGRPVLRANSSACAIVVPVILHGSYDTLASIELYGSQAAFLVLLIIIVVAGMALVRHVAGKAERISRM